MKTILSIKVVQGWLDKEWHVGTAARIRDNKQTDMKIDTDCLLRTRHRKS